MSLCSRPRRRMLASRGAEACIIGLAITAVIDFSPCSGGVPWCLTALCRALQTTRVSAGRRDRYHQVLCLACPPGGLDIQSFAGWSGQRRRFRYHPRDIYTWRAEGMVFVAMLCQPVLWRSQRERGEISFHDIMAHSCRMSR